MDFEIFFLEKFLGQSALSCSLSELRCKNFQSVKASSKLYCYYKMDRPFLRLAPFKVEILRFSPLAVLFRDVITDDEVTLIQMLATPRVSSALINIIMTVFVYIILIVYYFYCSNSCEELLCKTR